MNRCDIIGCQWKNKKTPTKLSNHRLPKCEFMRKKWLDIIGTENINLKKKVVFICSGHFDENAFNKTLNVIRLRDNAMPSARLLPDNIFKNSAVVVENDTIKTRPLIRHDTPILIMGNIIFSLIWLILLIFISFWLAGIAAGFYIIILPFTVCIEALSSLTDFLLSVVQFPKYCAQGMMDGRGFG